MKFAVFLAAAAGVLVMSGCDQAGPGMKGFPSQRHFDRSVYPAIYAVDRAAMGFPPFPAEGTATVIEVDRAGWKESDPPPNYDLSLSFAEGTSFYPNSSRFVYLKREGEGEGFRWVGETMTFYGPKVHTSDDQQVHERIDMAREDEEITVTGQKVAGTLITYSGPDERLANRRAAPLTLQQIGPVLREWGYDYHVDESPAAPKK